MFVQFTSGNDFNGCTGSHTGCTLDTYAAFPDAVVSEDFTTTIEFPGFLGPTVVVELLKIGRK
jgi:hypothetical protein